MPERPATYPWFRVFPAEFLVESAGLSNEAVGVLLRLLCHQWHRGDLPADPKELERIVRGTRRRWAEIESQFERRGDRLVHVRLGQERERLAAAQAQASDHGARAAAARWGQRRSGPRDEPPARPSGGRGDARAMHEHRPSIGLSDARALPEHCPSNAIQNQNQNQNPHPKAGGGVGEGEQPSGEAKAAADRSLVASLERGRQQCLARFGPDEGKARFEASVASRLRSMGDALVRLGVAEDVASRCAEASLAWPWDQWSERKDRLLAEAKSKHAPAAWAAWSLGLARREPGERQAV